MKKGWPGMPWPFVQMQAKHTRRNALVFLGAMAASGVPALAIEKKTPKELIATIPVFPWLTIGQSTIQSVNGPVQSMLNSSPRPWFRQGDSEITGGTFMTVSSLNGSGMLGELGLRILTMVFDRKQRAQLAILMVDRGWKDKNTLPLINRITNRYASLADPIRIQDADSESSDVYYLFDLGRFVIEISIPQFGEFLEVVFTTKEIHAQMRQADRTYDLFEPYLEFPYAKG